MNWSKVILFSLISVPITLASIYGLIPSAAVEGVIWIVFALIIAWLLAALPRPALSGFVTGLLMGIWSHLLSALLWATYVVHNQELGAQMEAQAAQANLSPQLFQVVSGPVVGVMYGLVLALLSWLFSLARAKRSASTDRASAEAL